jgi:hypothetical protein
MANPHYRETMRFGGEKLVAFLADNGLIGPPGLPLAAVLPRRLTFC